MKKDIENAISNNNLMADQMTIWVGNEGNCGKAEGYIIYDHCGIDNVREILPSDKFKVYAFRETDDLDGDPATIENQEVMVNFFGYFVTETDLDWIFTEKYFREVWDWDYDPWEE